MFVRKGLVACTVTCTLVGLFGCGDSGSPLHDDDPSNAPGGATPPHNPFLPLEIVSAPSPPPPIQGGTLLVTEAGQVIAADPDRDVVFVVDLDNERVTATIALEAGDQPGRMAETAMGTVHVVLRGSGAIATIDVASGRLVARTPVCPEPSGVAVDDVGNVHVVCTTGELVTGMARDGTLRTVHLGGDLRDVVVHDGDLYVSRFKTAEVLRLDVDGNEVEDIHVAPVQTPDVRVPRVAWRLRSTPGVGVHLLHQMHQSSSLVGAPNAYYGSTCMGPVATVLTTVAGPHIGVSQVLPGTLVTDFVVSPEGSRVATAVTGNAFDPFEALPDVIVSELSDVSQSFCNSGIRELSWADSYEVTSIAHTPDGALLIQSREPAVVLYKTEDETRVIELSDDSRADTGLALFHADAGRGITCASCHPAGREDGHTWSFEIEGLRRTQSLAGTLAQTAPYHWDGLMEDFETLMHEVFTGRMGGAELTPAYRDVFSDWLLTLTPPPSRATSDASERGRVLFSSAEVGCADCHAGPALTNNDTVDVGTGAALQVPSLLGIGLRAPFMHDGCAPTLADRFDPACGGDRHGDVTHLSAEEIADLVAYLETL